MGVSSNPPPPKEGKSPLFSLSPQGRKGLNLLSILLLPAGEGEIKRGRGTKTSEVYFLSLFKGENISEGLILSLQNRGYR